MSIKRIGALFVLAPIWVPTYVLLMFAQGIAFCIWRLDRDEVLCWNWDWYLDSLTGRGVDRD
ncbi:MAG: hypothetical protein ACTSUP_00380 [Candidatus Heimdallarchaeaceae archaeon]